MKSLKNNAKDVTMDVIIKNLKKEKTKKKQWKNKRIFYKKKISKEILFFTSFVLKITAYQEKINIIFSYLEKTLQQILRINNIL